MHSYLRAIGYSGIQSRAETEALIKRILQQSSERKLTALSDSTVLTEISYECADSIGITVRSELDISAASGEESLHIENYFPYFCGTNISLHDDVYISKKVDSEAYNGMCDDSRIGVSLIFYLQNSVDYLNALKENPESVLHPVTLSALSLGGHILLPVAESKQETIRLSGKKRSHLISEAKKGNQEAIENLTMEDYDLFSMISDRIRKEDIYSIVNTTFIPYGTESDVYTIVGKIESFRYLENRETKEELVTMQINCNDMLFDLCINREDLLGEPAVGRRFRGTIWMQGMVDFI